MATTLSIHQSIYDEIVTITTACVRQTTRWFNRHSSDRNRLARDAANDNLDKARALAPLLGGDSRALLESLFQNYTLIRSYETQFRDWGGHRNGYAEEIHRRGAAAFFAGHGRLLPLTRTVLEVDVSLVETYSWNGGDDGAGTIKHTVSSFRGYNSESVESNEIHSQVTNKISANFGASGFGLTAGVEAGHESIDSTTITNALSVTNIARDSHEEEMEFDWGQSLYIYYLRFDYTLADGSVRSCFGDGTFKSSTRLTTLPWAAATARL